MNLKNCIEQMKIKPRNTATIMVRVDADVLKRARAIMKARKIKLVDFVRAALVMFLEEYGGK